MCSSCRYKTGGHSAHGYYRKSEELKTLSKGKVTQLKHNQAPVAVITLHASRFAQCPATVVTPQMHTLLQCASWSEGLLALGAT